jgi:probable HAF family extracellular repeat protein
MTESRLLRISPAVMMTGLLAWSQAASFHSLGQMPGALPGAGSFPQAISADGSTIVGWAWVCPNGQTTCTSSDKTEAFLWTAAHKYQVLGDLGNSIGSIAFATSANGSVVAGQAPPGPASFGAFRWTAARGMVAIPGPMLFANAVTGDGLLAAGGAVWTTASGRSGIFGPFPGNTDQTQAYGLAGTVRNPVAVGAAIKGSDAFGPAFHAFSWTPAGGLKDLGLTTGSQSIALAISADESTIVGEAKDASGFWRAFRWTASTGMQDLGTLGGPESAALAVSKDGSVIVGTSLTSGLSDSNEFFRWTAKTGMQDLKPVLDAAGVHTADNWVQLSSAVGVSADGTRIAGYGLSPRTQANPFGVWTPFVIVLPLP